MTGRPDRLAHARNSKCSILSSPLAASSCDPWTVHSLGLFIRGHQEEETLEAIRSFRPAPMVFARERTDRATGEVTALSYHVRIDFASREAGALLPLGEVAALLGDFPWAALPLLTVNRVDLASDHLVTSDPKVVCDRVAEVHLPYCIPYRGPEDAVRPWLSIYHNAGKVPARAVAVAHYPRLEACLHRHHAADAATLAYVEYRVRQEVRFRGPGLRRRIGAGSMTPRAVLGSLAALVAFAERRLRPVFESGILSAPERDLPGEAALLALAEMLS